MKKSMRLPALLGVMTVLVIVRLLWPPGSGSAPSPLAEAVVAPRTAQRPPVANLDSSVRTNETSVLASGISYVDGREPGNAFAVRVVAAPSPPPTPIAAAAPAAAPQARPVAADPPQPPAAPLTVIGTYDDGTGPAVFVAGPNGALLARVGTVLLDEYKVTALTPQQLSLVRISSNQQVHLAIPRGPNQ
jgi:hypothetical protein